MDDRRSLLPLAQQGKRKVRDGHWRPPL